MSVETSQEVRYGELNVLKVKLFLIKSQVV